MGYEKQYAYKKGARPYGEPSAGTNFKDASPRPQTVGASRKVHRVADTSVAPVAPVKAPTETKKVRKLSESE
jgi:hypothetical protein